MQVPSSFRTAGATYKFDGRESDGHNHRDNIILLNYPPEHAHGSNAIIMSFKRLSSVHPCAFNTLTQRISIESRLKLNLPLWLFFFLTTKERKISEIGTCNFFWFHAARTKNMNTRFLYLFRYSLQTREDIVKDVKIF